MKNVENVKNFSYYQIDHNIVGISKAEGVIILPSVEAYKKYSRFRKDFGSKPKEGYFIWVKKSTDRPLCACVVISSMRVFQNLRNLIIVEKGVTAQISSVCRAAKKGLLGKHKGYSKIILKEGSEMRMKHLHNWGKEDMVDSKIEVHVKSRAKLIHGYRCMATPKELKIGNSNFLAAGAVTNLEMTILAQNGNVKIDESTHLIGERCNAVSRLRMITKGSSEILARAKMIATGAGTGHLDCMGLLLAKDSKIVVMPELVNTNKGAQLTHEASVGKISDDILNYLRSRGLNKDEAIDLIVSGFLREEEPLIYKGEVLLSETYM